MFDTSTFVIGALAFLLAWLWLNRPSAKLNLPPGPWALPVIGSAIQVALADPDIPFVALQKLAKKYGNIMSVQLGSVHAVVVTGFEAIKDMQSNPDFLSRLDDKWLLDKSNGIPCGIVFSRRDYWIETRHATFTLLKDFGFGKSSALEPLITEELKVFSRELKSQLKNGEGVIQIEHQFQAVFMNVVWSLLTGSRFEHDDPRLHQILNINRAYTESAKIGGGIVGLFPELLYMAPNWTGYNKQKGVSAAMHAFIEEIVAGYRKQGTYKTAPANFIECFLELIDQNGGHREDAKTLETIYSPLNLVAILEDFSLAGSDTSSNTTNFIVRYLVQNPQIQTKMQQEIDQVLGKDRWVTLDDKPKLNYTQAVILESLRISTVVPILPRKVYKDCKLGQYDIPNGTLILPNLWSANLNEDVWENPYIFNPERFLDANGVVVNSEKILSFGIGRRNCIGEPVAKSSMLMTIVSLFQQFSFEVDPASGVPPNHDSNKFTRNTVPYKVLLKLRQ